MRDLIMRMFDQLVMTSDTSQPPYFGFSDAFDTVVVGQISNLTMYSGADADPQPLTVIGDFIDGHRSCDPMVRFSYMYVVPRLRRSIRDVQIMSEVNNHFTSMAAAIDHYGPVFGIPTEDVAAANYFIKSPFDLLACDVQRYRSETFAMCPVAQVTHVRGIPQDIESFTAPDHVMPDAPDEHDEYNTYQD